MIWPISIVTKKNAKNTRNFRWQRTLYATAAASAEAIEWYNKAAGSTSEQTTWTWLCKWPFSYVIISKCSRILDYHFRQTLTFRPHEGIKITYSSLRFYLLYQHRACKLVLIVYHSRHIKKRKRSDFDMILRISSIRKKKRRNNISRLLKSTRNVSGCSCSKR